MDLTRNRATRCAVAAGTLVAVVGGTAFAGTAAFAATTPTVAVTTGALGRTLGSTLGSTTATVTGTTLPNVVATVLPTISPTILPSLDPSVGILNGVPITATVPVTLSTGNVLGSSRTGSTSSGSTTTNNSSTTNSSNTTNTSSTSSKTSTSTSTGATTSSSSNTANSSNSSNTASNSADNSSNNSSNDSTTNSNASTSSSNSSSTSTGPLAQVQLTRSASTVYPSKDGYGDDITFDVRPLDANGNRVAVTGKAYLVLDGKVVKTYTIDANTTTITWDGRIDGKIVAGSYSFVLDVVSATGEAARSTAAFSVSGKKLSTTTFVQTRALKAGKTSFALPKSIKKALAYGSVTVSAKVRSKSHPTVTVLVERAGADKRLVVKRGALLSKKVVLPAVSKKVSVVLPKRAGKARTIAITYRYSKLR